MSTQIEPALREVAVGQHGLFTTQQAHRAGMTAFALVEAVRGGALLHPGRGLYAVADLVDTWVSIPMAAGVESLNVAAAGAVVCFELVRRARA